MPAFQVRNARFGVAGEIYSKLAYCMEIDLSDEGKIKMVNAYLGTKLYKDSVHDRIYAGPVYHRCSPVPPIRSILRTVRSSPSRWAASAMSEPPWAGNSARRFRSTCKSVCSTGRVSTTRRISGPTNQLCGKGAVRFAEGMNFVVSYQTTRPADTRIHPLRRGVLLPLGAVGSSRRYLRKEYARNSFAGVNAFDGIFLL